MSHTGKNRTFVLLFAVMFGVCSCSTAGAARIRQTNGSEAPILAGNVYANPGTYPPPGRFASYATSPLPLDRYRESPLDARILSIAETKLANACRSQFGLQPTLTPYLALDSADQLSRRYSLVHDAATARRFGYHDPAMAAAPVPPPPPAPSSAMDNIVDYASPSGIGKENQVFLSKIAGRTVPTGGCVSEALRHLEGPSLTTGTDFAESLQFASYNKIAVQPAVEKARETWELCMSRHQYTVDDPGKVPYDLNSQVPSASEIVEASYDVTCEDLSHYNSVAETTEIALQDQAIQSNRRVLQTGLDSLNAALTKARQVAAK